MSKPSMSELNFRHGHAKPVLPNGIGMPQSMKSSFLFTWTMKRGVALGNDEGAFGMGNIALRLHRQRLA